MDEDLIFTFAVGYTTVRPVIPDQWTTHVTVAAQTKIEAEQTAYLMVLSRHGVEMVTSVRLVRVVA